MPAKRPPLKLAILGHVDHGKSTLIGRLLHESGSLSAGKREAIEASCKRRGMAFEWAFLLDALQAERDQNVTIDTAQIHLRGQSRDIVIIDAPGHKEFLRNMVTGASQADAALVVIDAKEGIGAQSRLHGYLLQLLGVRQLAVAVNKMDALDYDEAAFRRIEKDYTDYLQSIGLRTQFVIPLSAKQGDNIVSHSKQMPWYRGKALLEALEQCEAVAHDDALSLRFCVQDVYKFDDKRIIAGRVESGQLHVGDRMLFLPAGSSAEVASIEGWPSQNARSASAGASIGITLREPIFIERGAVASHENAAPKLGNRFRARLFWLGKAPLTLDTPCRLRIATQDTLADITAIHHVIDAQTLAQSQADRIEHGQIAEVTLRARRMLALDDYRAQPHLGRFVLQQDYDIAGGGIIDTEGFIDQRLATHAPVKSQHIKGVDFGITTQQRALRNGHFGGILWFTGLSGSGKSTIAGLLQNRLFARGYQVYVLDGDNIRQGLSRDLGFSPQERKENIRRVAEVAGLFARSGTIVITAFISPYHEDRELARAVAPELFHSVYIKASLEACEKRDVKGLYKKARAGEIAEFTGISAPYEAPSNPDLTVDTEALDAAQCALSIERYVEHYMVAPARLLAEKP